MPERRHRAALDHVHAAVLLGPSREPAQRNSGRQPSRRATGAKACSKARRSPASAPRWLTRMISPPGCVTRANSSSVRFRIGHGGDDVLRHHHVEERVGKAEPLPSITASASTWSSLLRGHALMRLAQHRLGIVDADEAVGAGIIRQRDAGADADVEDAARRCARRPRSRPCGRASNTAPNTRS